MTKCSPVSGRGTGRVKAPLSPSPESSVLSIRTPEAVLVPLCHANHRTVVASPKGPARLTCHRLSERPWVPPATHSGRASIRALMALNVSQKPSESSGLGLRLLSSQVGVALMSRMAGERIGRG